jgi:hypothetical protein
VFRAGVDAVAGFEEDEKRLPRFWFSGRRGCREVPELWQVLQEVRTFDYLALNPRSGCMAATRAMVRSSVVPHSPPTGQMAMQVEQHP